MIKKLYHTRKNTLMILIKRRKLINYPMIQMTAPTRDKIKATRAKGRPIKKPRGLQSPMVQDLGIKGGGERLLGKKRWGWEIYTSKRVQWPKWIGRFVRGTLK